MNLRRSAGAVLATLLLAISVGAAWNQPGVSEDEGLLLEYPVLLQHGELPFRDFESSYGIGTYLPLTVAYAAFGPSVVVERAVGGLYRLAVLAAIVGLVWSEGPVLVAVAGALAVAAMSTRGAQLAYGWFAGLACVLWALVLARAALAGRAWAGRAGGAWLAAGMLAGAACSIRPEFGPPALLGLLVMLWRARPGAWLACAAGCAVGLAPLIIDVAADPSGFVRGYVLGRATAIDQSRLPLGAAAIGGLAVLAASSILVAAGAVCRLRAQGFDPASRCQLAAAAVNLAFLPQAIQRADATHFSFIAPSTLAMLVVLVPPGPLRTGWRTALPVMAALAVVVLAYAVSDLGSGGVAVRHGGRWFPVASQADRSTEIAALRFVDAHTRSGQRLFVGPADLRLTFYADTSLYYLLPRLDPAGYYLELEPGAVDRARLARELNRSGVLILRDEPRNQPGCQFERLGSDALNRLVRSKFRPAFRGGALSVWLRPAGGGRPASTREPVHAGQAGDAQTGARAC